MKILKIFGLVVGIHVFALILIFANPGCSATTKPPPAPTDTVARSEPPATVTMPSMAHARTGSQPDVSPAPISGIAFNPDAPATASGGGADTRFRPTRPGTPAAGTLVSEPVVDVTPATTHTVVSGDNLWNLGKRFNVAPAALAAANNFKINTVLRPGQKLIIPGKPASATAAATANPAASAGKTAETVTAAQPQKAASGDAVKHVVKPGETLSAIARQYGVRQGEIAVVNNISDPQKIREGMELIIPGWQTPPSKTGKTTQKDAKAQSQKSTTPILTVEEPAPRPANEVPVIRVDEPPAITPSPKGN